MRSDENAAVVGALVWFAALAFSMVAVCTVWFRGMSTPHCGSSCDYALLHSTSVVHFWGCLGVLIGSLAGLLAARRRTWSWTIPTIGLLAVVVGTLVAHALASTALRF